MAKQNFLGLVKISGNNWEQYVSAKTNGAGKIIFADIATEGHVGKYIYANGIEYAVADSSTFANLEARVKSLEDWKLVVDSSIAILDSSVHQLEEWKVVVDASQASQDASISDHQTRIVNLENASAALGERIADVSQKVIDISTYVHTTVNASITALQAKDVEIDASISDISSRLSNVAITAADNSIGVNNTSIALAGDNYVSLTAVDGIVTASIKDSALTKGSVHATDVSLATKGYVDDQIAALESALELKGEVASAASLDALRETGSKGDVYVATATFKYPADSDPSTFIESGDLVIFKTDAAEGTPSEYFVVERNLDGAVTAGAALDSSHLVVGTGVQGVKTINVTAEDLETAIANANSALQTVDVSTSTGDYVVIESNKNASTANVSVGVITATLADASNGSVGLAMAKDVYDELTKVEEVMATSVTTMADTLGLDPSLGVTWSAQSNIPSDATYKEAIEGAYEEAHKAGVTSFGEKTGAISIDGAPGTDGSVAFVMDGSTLKGTVTGWSELVGRVTAAETSIGEVSTRVNEVSTRLNDLSTYVRQTVDASIVALQAKDEEIDASIDRLDASVSALERATYVRTVTGESDTLENANDAYVNVAATTDAQTGAVTLDSSVQLANPVEGETHATTTGLATDGWVKDFLAWEVIGD